MVAPLYSVGTWDARKEAYTPQAGLSVPAFNITLAQLRQAMRELREMGYSCHRYRDSNGNYENNDWAVLIERTDGECWKIIRRGWNR
jgi:monomeric isocitrate dehydrogenase